MREFTVLIGQIFLIALIQMVIEVFLDTESKKYLLKYVNIAGILAGLYLLLQFVYNNILNGISTFVNFNF